jgi:hypothetical protein
MNNKALLKRITINPEIFDGKPIIRGRRLAVEHVLGVLAAVDDVIWSGDWQTDPGDQEIVIPIVELFDWLISLRDNEPTTASVFCQNTVEMGVTIRELTLSSLFIR